MRLFLLLLTCPASWVLLNFVLHTCLANFLFAITVTEFVQNLSFRFLWRNQNWLIFLTYFLLLDSHNASLTPEHPRAIFVTYDGTERGKVKRGAIRRKGWLLVIVWSCCWTTNDINIDHGPTGVNCQQGLKRAPARQDQTELLSKSRMQLLATTYQPFGWSVYKHLVLGTAILCHYNQNTLRSTSFQGRKSAAI